jgi:outer membrane protein assembly factor BamA
MLKHNLGYVVIQKHFTNGKCMLVSLICAVVLGSCSYKITTQKNDYLLGEQVFKGNKNVLSEDLLTYLPQKPNRELFGIVPRATFRLWAYQWQEPRYLKQKAIWQTTYDSLSKEYEQKVSEVLDDVKLTEKVKSKYTKQLNKLNTRIEKGNGTMRFFGAEPPVYFSETDAKQNDRKLETVLFNKGFFAAKVSHLTDTLLGRVRVVYNIKEGLPYRLDSIEILTHRDTAIDSLLTATKAASFLKKGDNYNTSNITAEINRIEKLMRNNGYFEFAKQYFKPVSINGGQPYGGFIIDTLSLKPVADSTARVVNIRALQINYPERKNKFTKFYFGPIEFKVDDRPDAAEKQAIDTVYNRGIKYLFRGQHYSTKILRSRILIHQDSLVRQEQIEETNRQLGLLGQFEFLRVEDIDTTTGRLKPIIRVIPKKKYDLVAEAGMSFLQTLPGFSIDLTLRAYSIFNGLENLDVPLRFAYTPQFGFNGTTFIQTLQVGVNPSLVFPQILFPGRWVRRFDTKSPRTITSMGYNFSNNSPDFIRQGFRTNLTYTWRQSQTELWQVMPLDINIIKTATSVAFGDELRRLNEEFGSPLIRSFQPRSFVSSMSVSFRRDSHLPNENTKSKYFSFYLETGGFLAKLLPQVSANFETYQFLKFNIERRIYTPIGKKSSVVFRINSGFLLNLGANRAAPYEKYFTAGGGNSMRAWPARRLGLGAAYPSVSFKTGVNGEQIAVPIFRNSDLTDSRVLPTNTDEKYGRFDNRFEQLGDMVFETNLELRGKALRIGGVDINYATFLDVGNVWKLRPDATDATNVTKGLENAQNAVFQPAKLLKQLAVGTGLGVRIDFGFFLLRLDFGIKVYDPARIYNVVDDKGNIIETRDERFVLPKATFRSSGINVFQPQFGIGYPF